MSEPIVVERRVAAPPAFVYAYLTEADKWIRWQGIGATLDPRKGGIFSLAMPNGANARGEFVELVPDARVVFTWGWLDHPSVPQGPRSSRSTWFPMAPGPCSLSPTAD